MSTKTKNNQTAAETVSAVVHGLGVLMMSTAMVLGVLELPDDSKRVILPNQPAPAWVEVNEQSNNPIRREREETAPHFISYSEIQRTPSRSGRE